MVPLGLEPGLRSKNLDFREGSEHEPKWFGDRTNSIT